ncbi:MAG: primosomal protein N' [Halanaerobiaceae bacterium]
MYKFAKVIVNINVNQLDQTYDYLIPDNLRKIIQIGHVVKVPFGRRKVNGFVVGLSNESDIDNKKIKSLIDILFDISFFDEKMFDLFKWISSYYKSNLSRVINTAIPTGILTGKVRKKSVRLVKLNQDRNKIMNFMENEGKRAYKQVKVLKILMGSDKLYTSTELADLAETSTGVIQRLAEKEIIKYVNKIEHRRPYMENDKSQSSKLLPTKRQQEIITEISEQVKDNESGIFLLHGVTGSGKTEVYLQVIEFALEKSMGAIVLVPEISLTPMMVKRFYSRFGDQIAVLHSNLSLGERYDEWWRIKQGKARIAIGARSAIFAPVQKPALIIIDEEHESSYKQSEYPYYHAREVALKRSKIEGCTVVLGSATPSIESYHLAQKKIYKYLSLPERVKKGGLPSVEIIDMRDELKKGNTTIFSVSLQKAIEDALDSSKQVIIFLNRRGYANFILCRECGNVINCVNCDISMTYHSSNNRLNCHYCDYTIKKPKRCPDCDSVYLREFGLGTERLEEELKTFYPGVVIDRMDNDTTNRKGSHRRILEKLEKGETDILVGTQMITKGHDYPNIAVVGVISADTILNIPDFRSSERTFQLLTQVAGRTGRGDEKGKVIIQTYTPEHYSIKAAKKHDYEKFYRKEIEVRKAFNYPPFVLLVNIIIQGEKEEKVVKGAQNLGEFLDRYQKLIVEMFGPLPAPIAKINKRYRWQVFLKFKGYKKRNYVLTEIMRKFLTKRDKDVVYNIDVDPLIVL